MRRALLFGGIVLTVSLAQANPSFDVVAGQCPKNPFLCSKSNGVVTSTLFNIFLIDPLNDTTGAYANLFTPAFNAWNAAQPAGQKWTLTPADLSNNAGILVTQYRAYVDEPRCNVIDCGGAEIDISYTRGGGNDPLPIITTINSWNAVWSQSVFTNKKRAGSQPGNPYLDNDRPNGRQRNPPAYPYQSAGSSFYDKPGRIADASWQGQAFLTTANYTTRTLTVYDGVGWGFVVEKVPEPASVILVALGLVGCVLIGRRKKTGALRWRLRSSLSGRPQ